MSEDLEKWVEEESWRSFFEANEMFYGYVRDIGADRKRKRGRLAFILGWLSQTSLHR